MIVDGEVDQCPAKQRLASKVCDLMEAVEMAGARVRCQRAEVN